jgi:hypothetical protein
MEGVGSINPGFVVTDTFTVCDGFNQNPIIQCVKVNDISLYGSNCDKVMMVEQTESKYVNVYPTIVTDKLTIEMTNDLDLYIIIYSISGIKVVNNRLDSHNNIIPLDRLNSGLYFYAINGQDGIIKTGRFIKE